MHFEWEAAAERVNTVLLCRCCEQGAGTRSYRLLALAVVTPSLACCVQLGAPGMESMPEEEKGGSVKWESGRLRKWIYKWCKVWKCCLEVTAFKHLGLFTERRMGDCSLWKQWFSSCGYWCTDKGPCRRTKHNCKLKIRWTGISFCMGKCSEIHKFWSLSGLQVTKQQEGKIIEGENKKPKTQQKTQTQQPSKFRTCKDKRGWKCLADRLIAGSEVVDSLFIETYHLPAEESMLTYQPHMTCSRSNEDIGMPGICTASRWLQGPGLGGLCPAERSLWANLFQVLLSVDFSSHHKWNTFSGKTSLSRDGLRNRMQRHFWLSEQLSQGKGMHEKFSTCSSQWLLKCKICS